MTDHAAMEAINAALEDYYRGRIGRAETLTKITHIAGRYALEHLESK